MESKFKVNDRVLIKGQSDMTQPWVVVNVSLENNMFTYELMSSAPFLRGATKDFFDFELEPFPQETKIEKNPGCFKCNNYKRSDRTCYGQCKFVANIREYNVVCPLRGTYKETAWDHLRPEVANKDCTCKHFEEKYSVFKKIKNWFNN